MEKTRQKHNESLAEIKRLKEYFHLFKLIYLKYYLIREVNASRRERVIFDNVFKNLEQDLKMMEEELKKYLFETLQVNYSIKLSFKLF